MLSSHTTRLCRALAKEAEALGFELSLTTKSHIRAKHPKGGPAVVLGGTSRSSSGARNARALLRRIARELETKE